MTARSISIEAYERHIASGKQASQWMKLYEYMTYASEPKTRSELSEVTGMRMSSVCGRVNELINAGMLAENDRRKCTVTGEPAHTVTLKNQVDKRQQDLF